MRGDGGIKAAGLAFVDNLGLHPCTATRCELRLFDAVLVEGRLIALSGGRSVGLAGWLKFRFWGQGHIVEGVEGVVCMACMLLLEHGVGECPWWSTGACLQWQAV